MSQYTIQKSIDSFNRAKITIPGGVNSPVRAFKGVGGTPIFMKSASGAHLVDVDGNQYVDYINSWGPMILGHCHPEVVAAVQKRAAEALSFGAPTDLEIEMAELITAIAPNVDQIRLVSSGTEACMSALRLARGYTGKNKFIKFEGCYHGHADSFLVKAGSGLATFNIQTVPGITAGTANDTLTAPYNDLAAVKLLMEQNPNEIAAIIIEPVAGNMGCVLPTPEFIKGLRLLCDQHKALLIFDEVMTGFRLALGGAQEKLSIDADLVTYGKVIGGGMPVGAFGGKKEIMEHIAPVGNVYQAGTLSGNPLAVVAGYTTLTLLKNNPDIYTKIDAIGVLLKKELAPIFNEKGIAHTINLMGSMISVHFGEHEVTDFKTAAACDLQLFNKYFHHMLSNGVYLPPSAFETWFLSHALTDLDIEKTLEMTRKFLNNMSATKAILLVNLGSPDSTSVKDVRTYLNEFLMDERVIDIPKLTRMLLVKGIIVPFRAPKSAAKYKTIWNENGSPLIHITKELVKKVAVKTQLPTYMAMRYAKPNPSDVLREISTENPDLKELVLLPLYPHYALSSFETAVEHVKAAYKKGGYSYKMTVVKPFYKHPEYIAALTKSIQLVIDANPNFDQVLFSYHGIPERQVKKTDVTHTHCLNGNDCCNVPSAAHDFCYRHQVIETTKLVAKELNLPENKFQFSFQSRLGTDKWLKPYSVTLFKELPSKNIKNLIVVCPAFVSDCLETLEEIHVEGREDYLHSGGETFTVVPCLNLNDDWVSTIDTLVKEAY